MWCVLIALGIVVLAYSLRLRKPSVDVATVATPKAAGGETLGEVGMLIAVVGMITAAQIQIANLKVQI